MSLINIVSTCGAVGSAIVGGVYANFSARVMPRLGSLPDAEAIETMQKFNRNAVQAPFMTFFFGAAVASVWTVIHGLGREERAVKDLISAAGGVLYLAGWVLTIAYNVPRIGPRCGVEWPPANSGRAVLSLLGAVGLGVGTALNIFSKPQ